MSRYLPAILFLFLGAPLLSQKTGYIVTNEGDTIRGKITFPSSFSDDELIRFEAMDGDAEEFTPADVAGYHHPKKGTFVSSRTIDLTDKRLLGTPKFLERLATGTASLYKLNYTERIRGTNDLLLETPARKYYYLLPGAYLAVGNQLKLDELLEVENACSFQRKSYLFSDYQVGQFFRELSACKNHDFFWNEKSPKTNNSLAFYGGVGFANSGWSSGTGFFQYIDFNRDKLSFGEAGLMLPVNDGFRIVGSLSYDQYEYTGDLNIVPGVPEWNESQTITGASRIDASYLTFQISGHLALNPKAQKLRTYLIGGTFYGVLQQSDYLIESCYTELAGTSFRFFVCQDVIPGDDRTDGRSQPENLLGFNLGFWVDFLPNQRLSPFLKLTGGYSVSAPSSIYRYNEVRGMVGVRFR
ncbi:hypothetical protein QWY85_13780 [Neolewinella lacunae]|uniref:Uncharacterized protein n=1 Tax=Neolewinella lacunae TaxID=1517758 RepID=A0A923T756_9BACT|nr:hypothetical protein [Neolewinella lacunae]MBC6993219.1 hypothetical protein [Neolewinella lacunae]MDN3635734.1 hypothetical protein [Neolewinella lacunae]